MLHCGTQYTVETLMLHCGTQYTVETLMLHCGTQYTVETLMLHCGTQYTVETLMLHCGTQYTVETLMLHCGTQYTVETTKVDVTANSIWKSLLKCEYARASLMIKKRIEDAVSHKHRPLMVSKSCTRSHIALRVQSNLFHKKKKKE